MPRGDGTGPGGMGPMTGRGAGYCAGYSVPGYMNPFGGRGLGLRRGFRGGGMGFGFASTGAPYAYPGYYPAGVPAPKDYGPGVPGYSGEQELETLKNQADYLTSTLGDIKKRIEELEAKKSE